MESQTLRISDIFEPWLDAYAQQRTGRRRDRILAVGVRARHCLEAEIDRIATEPERHLIAWERQFGTPDPAGRAVGCDGLPTLLLVLTSENWLPADPRDRRVHLQVLGALGQWMSSPEFTDRYWSFCSVLDVQVAVDRLRADLRNGIGARLPGETSADRR